MCRNSSPCKCVVTLTVLVNVYWIVFPVKNVRKLITRRPTFTYPLLIWVNPPSQFCMWNGLLLTFACEMAYFLQMWHWVLPVICPAWWPCRSTQASHQGIFFYIAVQTLCKKSFPGAKTINVFRAWICAQLTICAQKWRNFVLFSTVSLRFVLSRVCVFLYSLGPWCTSCLKWIFLSGEQGHINRYY